MSGEREVYYSKFVFASSDLNRANNIAAGFSPKPANQIAAVGVEIAVAAAHSAHSRPWVLGSQRHSKGDVRNQYVQPV
jgi:hypothetical protein